MPRLNRVSGGVIIGGRKARLAAAVLAAVLAVPAVASSQLASQLRGQLAAREEDRDIGRAEARTARDEIVRLRAELAELRALEAATRGGGPRQVQLAALHRRETELAAELGRERGRLARFLGALQLYRRRPPPALLVSPDSAKDAVRAAILIRAMEPELARRARVAALRDEQIRVLRRAAAAANADVFASESALADRRAELEGLIVENAEAERRFDARSAAADQQAKSLADRLRRMGEPLASPLETGRGPSAMLKPVRGNLLRRFGDRSAAGQRSEGMTWSAEPNTPVRAPSTGVVEYAGPLKGWGGVLILRLGGGYHLVLAGVEAISVSAGQTVAAGRVLGRMGDGGRSAPELYLEVRKNGAPTDPGRWLRSAQAEAAVPGGGAAPSSPVRGRAGL